jgi:glycosyltransferase involved in cell wall biosynthesis
MNKIISVLMCSNKFDGEFRKSVSSILNQTFSDFEFIIIVNGVSNEIYNAVNAYCNDERIILARTSLKGLSVNLNVGLSYCQSDIICRMDADDVAYPKRLEILSQYMDEHPEIEVCGSGYNIIDENDVVLYDVIPIQSNRKIRRALYYKNPFCHPSVVFRRNIVEQVGGYSNYRFAQDYDLWLRLSDNKNILFANLPDKLIGYRSEGADARGAVKAYLIVADSYFHKLLRTGNLLYIVSSFIYVIKSIIKKIRVFR